MKINTLYSLRHFGILIALLILSDIKQEQAPVQMIQKGKIMMSLKKQMAVALTMSAIFIILNIIAVTSGTAEIFYLQVDQFINNLT